MRFDRAMPQDQIIVLAATDPNDGAVIFEIKGAEDGRMLNELKHCALR